MIKLLRFLIDWLIAFPLTLFSYSKYGLIKVIGMVLLIPWMIFLGGICYYLIFEL